MRGITFLRPHVPVSPYAHGMDRTIVLTDTLLPLLRYISKRDNEVTSAN